MPAPFTNPLIQPGDVTDIGRFWLPSISPGGGDLRYGGNGMGMGPSGSLYWSGYGNRIFRVSIVGNGATATVLDEGAGPSGSQLNQINPGDPNSKVIGNTLRWNSRIICSAYSFYDGSSTAGATHFAGTSLNSLSGPYRVGSDRPGLSSGWMGIIPPEWRTYFGGPCFTGLGSVSIISRSSYGPAFVVFDPDDLTGTTVSWTWNGSAWVASGGIKPATTLLSYPTEHQNDAIGHYDFAPMPLFNGATRIGGACFPEGTASVLFFERHGPNNYCYNTGPVCNDPTDPDKGTHSYPYEYWILAYDANDLYAVKQGSMNPWDVVPYASWSIGGGPAANNVICGTTFDPATNVWYWTENTGGAQPSVRMLSVGTSVAPSASQSPSLSPSASPSRSVSPSISRSPSPSNPGSPSLSPSASVSRSASRSASPSASPSPTPSGSASVSPSASGSASVSPSSSASHSASHSVSPSSSTSRSPSPSPAAAADLRVSQVPLEVLYGGVPVLRASHFMLEVLVTGTGPSGSVSPSASQSPSHSVSPSASPSATGSSTPSASASPTPSASPSPTPSGSSSVSPSHSVSPSVSPSSTPSASPSPTPSASFSPSGSASISPSASVSPSPSPPSGGGDGGIGINTTQGLIPEILPLVFVYMRLPIAPYQTYVWAEETHGHLPDPSSWYGGLKQGRILEMGSIRRELSEDGGLRSYTWTLKLDDRDRLLRTAANTGTLTGAEVFHYVVEDSVRRARGVPFHFASGIVTKHTPSPDRTYTIECSGALSLHLADLGKDSKVPVYRFSKTTMPGIDEALDGQTAPVCLGVLSDESTGGSGGGGYVIAGVTNPMGVVPPRYVGYGNLQQLIGGANVEVDIYILSLGAVAWIQNFFYSPPVWGEEEDHAVNDMIKPKDDTPFFYLCTSGGTTGTSEPTWPTGVGATVGDGSCLWTRGDPLDVLLRYVVPTAAYGTIMACPYMPGWTVATNSALNYIDYPMGSGGGQAVPIRSTPMFFLRSHRYARALREGRITLGCNLIGLAENADGSGQYLDTPEELAKFVLTQQIFNLNANWTSYFPIPLWHAPQGDYSVINTQTFDDAALVAQGFLPPYGYRSGFILGRDGTQQSAFQFLTELCVGANLSLGENIHGQVVCYREDPTATAVARFTDLEDIEVVACDREMDKYINKLEYRYAYRYAPQPWPTQPWDSEKNLLHPWISGTQVTENTVAQLAMNRVVKGEIMDNYVIRERDSADNIAQRYRSRCEGPPPGYDGARVISITGPWHLLQAPPLLGFPGGNIDLGSYIEVVAADGFQLEAELVQVRAVAVDALKARVTLEGRVVTQPVLQSPSSSQSPSASPSVSPSPGVPDGLFVMASSDSQALTAIDKYSHDEVSFSWDAFVTYEPNHAPQTAAMGVAGVVVFVMTDGDPADILGVTYAGIGLPPKPEWDLPSIAGGGPGPDGTPPSSVEVTTKAFYHPNTGLVLPMPLGQVFEVSRTNNADRMLALACVIGANGASCVSQSLNYAGAAGTSTSGAHPVGYATEQALSDVAPISDSIRIMFNISVDIANFPGPNSAPMWTGAVNYDYPPQNERIEAQMFREQAPGTGSRSVGCEGWPVDPYHPSWPVRWQAVYICIQQVP